MARGPDEEVSAAGRRPTPPSVSERPTRGARTLRPPVFPCQPRPCARPSRGVAGQAPPPPNGARRCGSPGRDCGHEAILIAGGPIDTLRAGRVDSCASTVFQEQARARAVDAWGATGGRDCPVAGRGRCCRTACCRSVAWSTGVRRPCSTFLLSCAGSATGRISVFPVPWTKTVCVCVCVDLYLGE